MKKVIRIAILLIALVVVAVVVLALNINTVIKNGVETVGPMVLGVDIELRESKLSLFSGGGSLKGLKVHNPKGYKTDHLFNLEETGLVVDLMSLTGDTIHINKILVDAPHVIYEGGLLNSNLKTVLDGLKGKPSSAPSQPGEEGESGGEEAPAKEKKLIIDHLLIQNVKMSVSSKLLRGKELSVTLPTIELRDIGKEQGGATPTEVITQVLKELYTSVEPAVRKALAGFGANFDDIKDQLKNGKLDEIKDQLKKGQLEDDLKKNIKNELKGLFGK